MPYQDSLLDRLLKLFFRDVETLSEEKRKSAWFTYSNIWGIDKDGNEDRNDLYLRRFYLYRGKRKPHIYLHHIIRSDYDRAPHDHPWDFISFVLWRGYIEHRQENTKIQSSGHSEPLKWKRRKYPFTFIHRKARQLHRLELWKPAWTLVFSFEKAREWGFQTEDRGWIPWQQLGQYIKDAMPW